MTPYQLIVADPMNPYGYPTRAPLLSRSNLASYASGRGTSWWKDKTNPVLQEAKYTFANSDRGVTPSWVYVRELDRWVKLCRRTDHYNDIKPRKYAMYALEYDYLRPEENFYVFVTPGRRTAYRMHHLRLGGWDAWYDAWEDHMSSLGLETVFAQHVVEHLNQTYNIFRLSYHSTPKGLLDGFIDECSLKLSQVRLEWLPPEERSPYLWRVDPGVVTKKRGGELHDSRGSVKFHTYGYDDIECEPVDHRHQQWWSSLAVTGSPERSLQVDSHRDRLRKKREHKNHLLDVFSSLGLDISFRRGEMVLSRASTSRLQEAFEDVKLRRMFVQALRRG